MSVFEDLYALTEHDWDTVGLSSIILFAYQGTE